jgi:prolyl-tRNA synthetase
MPASSVEIRSRLSLQSIGGNFPNILLALAETHHDEKGLTIPHPAAPFDVYLMHVPGKEMDTRQSRGNLSRAAKRGLICSVR